MISSISRVYSYVVKNDNGLAPNPFWSYCTLALCTPNHQGIKAREGDWIVGSTCASRGHKLLFAMRLTEDKMHFNQYFHDPRFEKKKSIMSGSWQQRCGDNIYHLHAGSWEQSPNPFHDSRFLETDTRHPYVFISRHFYYFGCNAIELPPEYSAILKRGRGCIGPQWYESRGLLPTCARFIDWLQRSYDPGVHGKPLDSDTGCDRCS